MAKKRGQVTFFIILIIIVIVLVFVAIQIFKPNFNFDLSAGRATVVNDFVVNCIEETTRNGLKIMGLSGGLIEIPEDLMPRSAVNQFSNSLLLGSNNVMYWYYKSVNNIDMLNVPEKSLMEQQLSTYISDNIGKCLNNFESLKFDGYKIEAGNPEASVKIKDTAVEAKVKMPVIVVIGDNSIRLNDFSKSISTGFGRLYNAAREIAESNTTYLEDLTFDTIALDDGIPLSDTEFDCNERKWEIDKIKARLIYLLSRNIANVKIKGTSIGNIVSYYQWDALKKSYKDITTSLLYSSAWPLYLNVGPSENNILKSDNIIKLNGNTEFLSGIFCLQNWNFVYSIKYPVLITINAGEDLLQFGYMVVLENNQPKKNILAKDDFGNFKQDFCSKKLGSVSISVLAPQQDGSYLSVPNSDLFFKCFNFECPLGKSDSKGEYSGNIPQCVNGFMIARKEGYHEGKLPISSNQVMSGGIKLDPIYELNLNLLLFSKDKAVELKENEKAIISLTNIDKGYSVSVIYPSTKKIRLISGTYNVSTIITSVGQPITIPGETIEKCVSTGLFGLFGFGGEKCSSVEMPDLTLNDIVVGGNTNQIEISRGLLSQGRTITLYSYYDGIPKNQEEYGSIYERISTNRLSGKFNYDLK